MMAVVLYGSGCVRVVTDRGEQPWSQKKCPKRADDQVLIILRRVRVSAVVRLCVVWWRGFTLGCLCVAWRLCGDSDGDTPGGTWPASCRSAVVHGAPYHDPVCMSL